MYEYLLELSRAVAVFGASTSILEIVICTVMNKSLHTVWILVDTLQFFAFLSTWQIPYEPITKNILRELRRVVLGEYMDDLDIGKRFQEWLGIEPAVTVVGEKSGKNRLGTESLY